MHHPLVLAALAVDDLWNDQLHCLLGAQYYGISGESGEEVSCYIWDHRSCTDLFVFDVQVGVL